MRHLADHLLGRGIDDRDGPAVGALGPGAVDHQGDITVGHDFLRFNFRDRSNSSRACRATGRDNAPPARRWKSAKARYRGTADRRLNTPAAKMVTDRKTQLVAPDRQWPAADHRLVGAAVGIRDRCVYPVIAFARQLVKLDGHANGRPAGMGVEHMGAEPAVHLRHALARHLRRDAQARDVEDLLQGGGEFGRRVVAAGGARTGRGSNRACDGARRR